MYQKEKKRILKYFIFSLGILRELAQEEGRALERRGEEKKGRENFHGENVFVENWDVYV